MTGTATQCQSPVAEKTVDGLTAIVVEWLHIHLGRYTFPLPVSCTNLSGNDTCSKLVAGSGIQGFVVVVTVVVRNGEVVVEVQARQVVHKEEGSP